MKKFLITASATAFISLCCSAQPTRQHIEKALTDPKATENAAKADAMLIDKKKVKDSLQYDTAGVIIKKEQACRSKKRKKTN